MLEREHRGRREQGHLLAIAERLEGGAHGDLGLAEPHVAAQQAIHGMLRFHVALDLFGRAELVLGLGVFERVLKLALPVGIGRKRESFRHAPLGVKLEKLVRHIPHSGLDTRLAGGPGRAAQTVELRLRFTRAAILLDQVHARERHVEFRLAGILQQHEVALLVTLDDLSQAQKLPHAVGDVHHAIADFEIGEIGGEGGELPLGDTGPRDQIGRIEQILRADEGDSRFDEDSPAPDVALYEISVRHRAREVRSFRQVLCRGFIRREPQLERHRVLLENIG